MAFCALVIDLSLAKLLSTTASALDQRFVFFVVRSSPTCSFSELGVIHTTPLQDFLLVETLVETVFLLHLPELRYLCQLLFVCDGHLRDQKILGRRVKD